jgi:hypothetical protein
MSQQVPKISEINANIIAQLEASLGTTIPIFPKSFSRVLAAAIAAIFIIGYKFAGWVCLQLFVKYASYDSQTVNGQTFIPLVEWGNLIGVGAPKPATRWEGEITVPVQQQIGDLKAGSFLLKKDTGVIYSVIADVPLDAATVTAKIQSVDDDQGNSGFGEISNLSIGDELEFANPLPYVSGTVVVSAETVVAADAESENAYRDRVATRFQKRPQGGARVDYQIWGELVEGIDLVLPYTGNPSDNHMTLFSRSTTEVDGFPTPTQLDAVKDSVLFDEEGFATRAPPGVLITSNSITRTEVEIEIQGLGLTDGSSITLTSLQQKIQDALTSHLLGLEPFILGVSTLPPQDRVSSAAIGGVIYAVTESNAAFFGAYVVRIGGNITTTKVLDEGQLAKLKLPVIYS